MTRWTRSSQVTLTETSFLRLARPRSVRRSAMHRIGSVRTASTFHLPRTLRIVVSPFRKRTEMWSSRLFAIRLSASVSRCGRSLVVGPALEEPWACRFGRSLADSHALHRVRSTHRLRRRSAMKSNSPLMSFVSPSALAASRSDRRPFGIATDRPTRRAYLTRLRSAFRLSQPLGVLFLSMPSGLVACR